MEGWREGSETKQCETAGKRGETLFLWGRFVSWLLLNKD